VPLGQPYERIVTDFVTEIPSARNSVAEGGTSIHGPYEEGALRTFPFPPRPETPFQAPVGRSRTGRAGFRDALRNRVRRLQMERRRRQRKLMAGVDPGKRFQLQAERVSDQHTPLRNSVQGP